MVAGFGMLAGRFQVLRQLITQHDRIWPAGNGLCEQYSHLLAFIRGLVILDQLFVQPRRVRRLFDLTLDAGNQILERSRLLQ